MPLLTLRLSIVIVAAAIAAGAAACGRTVKNVPIAAAPAATMAELWQEPSDSSARNLFDGPGGATLRPKQTTFAFVAGMLPLITSKGVGSGFSKAMASVVVGGQTFSLLLTLVAVPVIYTWFDDLAAFWRRKTRKKAPIDRGASELGLIDMHEVSKTSG